MEGGDQAGAEGIVEPGAQIHHPSRPSPDDRGTGQGRGGHGVGQVVHGDREGLLDPAARRIRDPDPHLQLTAALPVEHLLGLQLGVDDAKAAVVVGSETSHQGIGEPLGGKERAASADRVERADRHPDHVAFVDREAGKQQIGGG